MYGPAILPPVRPSRIVDLDQIRVRAPIRQTTSRGEQPPPEEHSLRAVNGVGAREPGLRGGCESVINGA